MFLLSRGRGLHSRAGGEGAFRGLRHPVCTFPERKVTARLGEGPVSSAFSQKWPVHGHR